MTKEELKKAIIASSASGRLTCDKAHELAEKLGVPIKTIGAVCDEIGIRISSCRLGCF